MKINVRATSILFILLFFSISLAAQNKLERTKDFGANKGNLKMYTYVPKSIDSLKEVPLVVVLHGCSQSARKVARATDWNKLADSLQFIVLYPEQKRINNLSKCFNWFIGFKAKKDRGEVASIKKMIDFSIESKSIDTTKIFVTGLSAGGAMSHIMLNAYPRLFNAGALLGTPSTLLDFVSADSIQPRVLIMQGEIDPLVHKNNGKRLLNKWSLKHRIDPNKFEFEESLNGNPLISSKTFYKNNHKVLVYLLAKNVGHQLLIDPGEGIKHGGKKGLFTTDIDFFSTYYIADFFGLVKK